MNLKKTLPYLCLVVVLLSQLIFGSDLTHHLHNSWIYNKMIQEAKFIPFDPYLLNGEQITFAYGLIAYPLSGLFWFLLKDYTIDILMALFSIATFVIVKILVKKDFPVSVIMLSMLFHTIGDTYVFYLSNVLFYLGLLLYYKKLRFWQIPIILSCINHPVALLAAAYFIFKDKKLIAVIATIFIYFLVITLLFSKNSNITFYLPLVFIIRTLLLLFPVFIIEDVYAGFYDTLYNIHAKISAYSNNKTVNKASKRILDSSKRNINLVKSVFSIKLELPYVIAIVAITFFSTLLITVIYLQTWNFSLYSFDTDSILFNDFPNITGKVRVIDYTWLPSLLYSRANLSFMGGSFRENNNINFATYMWDNASYMGFVLNEGVDYLLVCKQCNLQTNEAEIVRDNFNVFWENDYYSLFKVR